jgi:hypothetical protein
MRLFVWYDDRWYYRVLFHVNGWLPKPDTDQIPDHQVYSIAYTDSIIEMKRQIHNKSGIPANEQIALLCFSKKQHSGTESWEIHLFMPTRTRLQLISSRISSYFKQASMKLKSLRPRSTMAAMTDVKTRGLARPHSVPVLGNACAPGLIESDTKAIAQGDSGPMTLTVRGRSSVPNLWILR